MYVCFCVCVHTLVSVRRVVPSSDVTTETCEVGVPGSSSIVTVSSTTSCGSCIIAREVWLLGLCSCQTEVKGHHDEETGDGALMLFPLAFMYYYSFNISRLLKSLGSFVGEGQNVMLKISDKYGSRGER